MTDAHLGFWPRRMPTSLPLPAAGVHHNLEVSARRYPECPALVYYGEEITYRRLLEESRRLAGYLQREAGLSKGDRVLLYMQNSPQFVVAYYAALMSGGVVVPANPMLLTEELEHYVEDSGARLALVGQELLPRVLPLAGREGLGCVIVAAYSDYLPPEPEVSVPAEVAAPRETLREERVILWEETLRAGLSPESGGPGPEDVALLPYTSGTTGRPKGCVHTHRTVQATLVGAGLWVNLNPASVALATLPLFHVTGMQHSMNAPIYYGGTVVLMTRWDREAAARLIERRRCTHWTNISTMVVDFLSPGGVEGADLSSLMCVGGGGAPLPEAVGERLHRLTGLRYMEGYGLSETVSQTHMNPPDRPKMQCLGIPSFDVDARVVDPDTLEELGPGEQGEIVVSGPQVMRGYWQRPDADAEVFFERDGRRFLRTGDLGRYDEEGYFFMVDRIKRMINAGGYKVWPAEVESVLYAHPAVREVCVIRSPDPRRGETVKAVVVPAGEVSGEEVISWARERLAAYKCPRLVEFVGELPKSGSGKILWRALGEREERRAVRG
ncbi:AMP-dependent synthetase and ligase [Rubrobacter xylanophilus DSM 9941]|uniref:AMP-dependent synthetase and ligase n=1 Tax=Rubrobacter xylanophilus (strain DSM 9941 / JCM 11954 / NBRC 16129 / PRD-1) TaxID=266117 RepID=Q1ATL1_RUBXD|nr:long-chain fatty acid--CoA ligase [Rubrobacter xylanophilus]ABG05267.1 AMP-dependent synthetase and ligase [Rubrobacter xylanophilus DSM 9941]